MCFWYPRDSLTVLCKYRGAAGRAGSWGAMGLGQAGFFPCKTVAVVIVLVVVVVVV